MDGRDERPPRRPGSAGLAAVLVMLLSATGCDNSKPTHRSSSTPSFSAPPQSSRATAEQHALAAYRAMWQAYTHAGRTDPDDPELAHFAAGRTLQTLKDGLAAERRKHQVLKGNLVINPHVSGASPETDPQSVTITDCVDDTKILVYKRSSGEPINHVPGGRRLAKATVTKHGTDGWKVTRFGIQAVNTCD